MEKSHYVYILRTERDTLYCGYTDNINKRITAHIKGKGAKYTKANKPVTIEWIKSFSSKSAAMKMEYHIKHNLTRAQKLQLINSELSEQLFPEFQ